MTFFIIITIILLRMYSMSIVYRAVLSMIDYCVLYLFLPDATEFASTVRQATGLNTKLLYTVHTVASLLTVLYSSEAVDPTVQYATAIH